MTEDQTEDQKETLLEQMGGISGLVYSTLPILVFIPVNAVWHLQPAIYAALGTAAAILVWRILRKEKIQPAISGFIGVGICAYIAHRTGTAKGYFLFGIYTSLVYGGVFLLSMLARWPLVGVIWSALNGKGSGWRGIRTARTAYDAATACWVVVFAARYLVQSQLYDADQTGWLAVARIVMGWPLAAVALLATFAAIRRADRCVDAVAGEMQGDAGEAEGTDSAGDAEGTDSAGDAADERRGDVADGGEGPRVDEDRAPASFGGGAAGDGYAGGGTGRVDRSAGAVAPGRAPLMPSGADTADKADSAGSEPAEDSPSA